ncbi:MAG: DUF3857 domain-containing transglutaminase family protein [Acidobacteriaceae bacterium]|nr:DUF3857 domain-containing transglutaminase family protein [Acidobacteriaceae bacterium]
MPCAAGGLGKDKGFGNKKQLDVPQWALDANKTPTPIGDLVNDASTVILYDEYVETIDAEGRATERERELIRVLKPQGRRAACSVTYDIDQKINYFHAWTITADGKQFQAKDTDFTEMGSVGIPIMLSTDKTRVAHPPAVDVGATVVCESEELMAPYMRENIWQIQSRTPVVYQAMELDLPPGRAYSQAWHNYKAVTPVEAAPNHWRWEIRNMPALTLRDIPSPPKWSALAARMSVQWGEAAVEGVDSQWRAIGQWTTDLQKNRPDPSPEITAKTESLIAGTADFYTNVSRITEFIQKNIRYFIVERGIGGLQSNRAPDIFRNQYGDCKDKTTLLISMLQVAGIRAYYMLVDTRRGVVDPAAPSMYGNHMITAIELPEDVKDPRWMAVVKAKDGKRYLIFDPTNDQTPAGNLPSYLQGGYGLLARGASSQIIALPVLDPDSNGTEQKGTFKLSADGTLSGTVETKHIGTDGAELRDFLKFTDEDERRKWWEKHVASMLPGVTLDSFSFTRPATLDKPLEIRYGVTEASYARAAGPLLLVRPRVVGALAAAYDDKPRTVPINLKATGSWRDVFDIALPSGYVVDETPDPVSLNMDFASYHSSVTAKENALHYEREYTIRKVELPADRAADFRKMQAAILMDEKGTAVLKKQ